MVDYGSSITDNISFRSSNERRTPVERFALLDVCVFDGSILQPPSDVINEGGKIGKPCTAHEACPLPTETFDAQGMTLLPGLIDSHTHPDNVSHLDDLPRFGITTAVSALCPVPVLCVSLRNHTGLTSLVMASFITTSPNSTHAKLVGAQGAPLLIHNATQVASFVVQQVAAGSDFIKAIGSAPQPGLNQESANRVGRLLEMFKGKKTAVCPTLTMMRAIVEQMAPRKSSYAPARQTVTRLHREGVPILAGTSANTQPATPAKVEFRISLHEELENIVEAGLSPVEALNAATILPTRYFGLKDRSNPEHNDDEEH